jgi:hypothetical protein
MNSWIIRSLGMTDDLQKQLQYYQRYFNNPRLHKALSSETPSQKSEKK